MGETLAFLATFLLVTSLQVQAQSQEELSKEGILCVAQNREKTALGRWLYCLQISSSVVAQDEGGNPLQSMSDPEQLTVDDKVEQFAEKKDALAEQKTFVGHADGSKCNSNLVAENAESAGQMDMVRYSGEDALLSWLKLNLAVVAFFRMLSSLVRKCIWKKESFKPSVNCSMEDDLTAVPEISKAVIVDDISSKNHSSAANLQMLGSSLGSVVGAVFSEVLLKLCSSGSVVPSDKICMIMESALEELLAVVQEDECCLRLVGDFLSSFKSMYTTMYKIHGACGYGGLGVRDSNLKEDNDSVAVMSNCEKECMNATVNSCTTEVIHSQGTCLGDDAWPVKEKSSPHNGGADTDSKQRTAKPRSVQGVGALPELSKCSKPLAEELDSGALPASAFDYYELKSDMARERGKDAGHGGGDDPSEETLICASVALTERTVTHLDYEVDDASSICDEPPGSIQSNADGRLAVPAFVGSSHGSTPEFQKVFLKFYERHVRAQEQHNQFQFVKLRRLLKQQTLEEEKIQLASAANGLMRENIDLGRSKASFKENKALEQQAQAAHMSFCTMCADELAAGLCVMLTTLVYSVRMYSFALLNDLVSMCRPAVKEPRRSVGFHMDWFYNSLDSLAGKLQAVVCHFTVTGRILIGSIMVGVVAQSLLRRSIMNSSQAMPATILIIVLGGVCGFVGKVSIDSLGGSGIVWWLVWGTFCSLHALTNCFTPSIYRLLHGSPTRPKSRFGLPFWVRRLAFHSLLVLVFPLLAGLLPFGTLSSVINDLVSISIESFAGVFASCSEWALLSFQK